MLTTISIDEWASFIDNLPNKMIFHHPGWLLTLTQTYQFPLQIVGWFENGTLLSALPMMQVRTLKGAKRYVSLPFTDFFEIPAVSPDARTNLLKEMIGTFSDNSRGIEIRDFVSDDTCWQPSQSDWLHTIELGGSMDALVKKFSSNHRKSLGVASKRGAEPRILTDEQSVRDFYQLHVKTRKRKGLPVQSQRFFELIYQHLIQAGHGGVVGVYTQNQMIAGGLFLTYGDVLTLKFNASDSDFLHLRPNHLVYYETISWGSEHGYRYVDCGKTAISNQGLRLFKLGWGAVEKPLFYSHYGNNPAGQPSVSVETEQVSGLFRYLSWLIKISPTFVCRGAGELFYRFLS